MPLDIIKEEQDEAEAGLLLSREYSNANFKKLSLKKEKSKVILNHGPATLKKSNSILNDP